ncbi:hypothetical protein BEL04_08730 [Mucilaginibacter sp. PPCGB 2223]|uniref:hypothetical protein n=1 Tax=Mucilaginibacter sp. PPCGB 2223 TaxID=1886027 RepID=UPI0008246E08|nr:hypothetical protein [Mucilaginibacter sp. PPCGB 2223]OCX54333.1 hypothetical protein BEL04_08730 [Mucilaginibacter sp. PPCGB 2223]
MAEQPDFYIIAGPNGAGKSTFGSLFIPPDTFYFNGDLVFADLCKRYPHIEPERLGGGVAVQLEKDRDAALAVRASFAFESNYSNQLAVDISLFFKEEGYRIHLIYFGLPDLIDSTARVRRRVDMGGHNVTDETILFNRDEGIRRVCENLSLYDTVSFMDTFDLLPKRAAVFRPGQGRLHIITEGIEWFERAFKPLIQRLIVKQKLQTVARKRPRKGRGPRL